MRTFRLADMQRGWFVGPFAPTALDTAACEVALKRFAAGEREAAHYHAVATELTLVIAGRVRMGAVELGPGEGLVLAPGEVSDFEALTEAACIAVKVPGVPGDKFPAEIAPEIAPEPGA